MSTCPLCHQHAKVFVRYLSELICRDCMKIITDARAAS